MMTHQNWQRIWSQRYWFANVFYQKFKFQQVLNSYLTISNKWLIVILVFHVSYTFFPIIYKKLLYWTICSRVSVVSNASTILCRHDNKIPGILFVFQWNADLSKVFAGPIDNTNVDGYNKYSGIYDYVF